jgi:transcriptional regulator with XRE-family HTH domain
MEEGVWLKQRELARRVGTTGARLSQFERGYNEPNIGELVRLSDVFGVSLDQLVRGEPFDMPVHNRALLQGMERFESVGTPEEFRVVGRILSGMALLEERELVDAPPGS